MPAPSIPDYQIGWICALPKELTAARAMLDEEHDNLPMRMVQDGNTYVLGRVHNHNVVIACLPAGVYGTNSAAVVATNMLRTFTNVRLGFMVGIGGGIPDLERGVDIRLGDVVVSQPDQTHGGVVQYDLRKNLGDGVFERKGSLNRPPSILLGAVSRLQSNHQMNQNQILEDISHAQQRFPSLIQAGFTHPGLAKDILYCSKPRDHDDTEGHTQCDHGVDTRKARSDQRPYIHYGTIASGNELIKNALERDRLGRELGAKCVEMEAVGLMNDFPCIVIRGICDYADHHKNDMWQEYAAVTASAYTRELLSLVPLEEKVNANINVGTTSRAAQRFPFPRNDDFIVRTSIFSELERLLPPRSQPQSAVLWGLGGSGKTQIALEFAYRRYLEQRWTIFWVHASSYNQFLDGYSQVATYASLPATLQGSDLLTGVRSWLESQANWLLVIDNADDLSLFGLHRARMTSDSGTNLMPFVPCGPHGTILWTTRDERAVGHLVGVSRGINVGDMTVNEAGQLLTELCGVAETTQNETFMKRILEYLDHLPLAISQAAAFIRARNISYRDYLGRLGKERKRWRMLAEEGSKLHRLEGVPNNVMETWQITVDYLERAHPLAHWILMVIVYYHNQDIPWSLVKAVGLQRLRDERNQQRSYGDEFEHAYSSEDDDSDVEEDEVRTAIGRLTQFSLVRARLGQEQELHGYNIHKLVQDATRSTIWHGRKQCKGSSTHTPACMALYVLSQEFPSGKYGTWEECAKLLSHALNLHRCSELANHRVQMCDLLSDVFRYLLERKWLSEAEEVARQLLKLRKEEFGERHPETIMSMANLALMPYERGRPGEAEERGIEALKLSKEVLGEMHPHTINMMANLALTFYQQGRLSEAEKIEVEVLELRKEVLGEQHPDTLNSVVNLASTLSGQGKLDEVEKIEVEVLERSKEVLGERHPDTIRVMDNLGSTIGKQGRLGEAWKIQVEVLELRKDVLGEKHPDTISTMGNIAFTLFQQGRLSDAEALYQRALELRKEVQGDRHPHTIESIYSLAYLYYRQRRLDESEQLLRPSIELFEEVLGKSHDHTLGAFEILDECQMAGSGEAKMLE